MKQKIALFDFDRTVISKDSILILYDKTCKKIPGFRSRLYGNLIKGAFSRNGKKLKTAVKEEFLSMLAYYSDEELQKFVHEDVMAYAFKEAIDEIHRLKEEGYYIMLVSASVENYLVYVKDCLPFDHIIGTVIDEDYKLVGENNRHEQKVSNILAHLQEKNMVIDYDNSLSYSDSLSADRPMMELTKSRYLINNPIKAQGYNHLHWTDPRK
ncbi:HAD family hydrolase [Aedoeadaptatus coxii]|uniref:HAD family hydrolase n=1 Tax=Aedoeadaptatus coxii TaxID=755172 RepID=UPI002AD47035|nr:HAD family hydrolase [Peptoniphilus coxii]